MYTRQVFNIMDLLGSLGGLSTVVFAVGNAVMFSYSSTNQKFSLVGKVFNVKEKSDSLDTS